MKRMYILSLLVVQILTIFTGGVMGRVKNTYNPDSSQISWWSVYGNGAPAVQHFVVPTEQICTKVEVLVEKGAITNSSYDAQLQVYDSSNNYLGGGSLSADQFASSSDWVAVDGLSLEAGSYYVQVFTNDIGFQGFMHTQFDASNAYTEGYGAIGWNGGTEVNPVGDFAGRLSLIPNDSSNSLLYLSADIAGLDGIGENSRDYYVNIYDLLALGSSWLKNCDLNSYIDLSGPDMKMDGIINCYDLALIASQWCMCTDPENLDCPLASRYQIVLSTEAIASEQKAAQELQRYLKEMIDVVLPIVTDDVYVDRPMIAVGFNDKLPQELSEAAFGELGDEEIIIKSSDDILLLAGGRPRGALYAVYEFLHKHGVRWYTPTYTKIPSYFDIQLLTENYRYNPRMRSRSQLVGNAPTQEWTAANRINTMKLWSALDQEYGGGHGQGPDMHTFHRMISNDVLEQHPEWLAEVDGQRELPVGSTWGLCLSNLEVRQYLINKTIEWAKQHPDKDSIWIGQNDGSDFCTCSQCQSFYDSHGGEPSSLIVQLANELAGLLSLEMQDKVVKTLAYHWSLMPPDRMQVRDDVIVVFCAQGDFFQPIATDPDRADLRAALASWKNICNNFEVYLYSTPWENYWFSSPSMYSGAENIKWASQNGITNVYTQVSGYGDTYGSEFMDLRAWVYARLAWDPTLDIQSLIEDFVYGYYGPAAESVLNAISLTHSNVFDANGNMISYNNSDVVPNYINPATVRAVNQTFAGIYSTLSDETYKDHLELAWLPYLWTDFWLGYSGPGVYNDVTSMWKVPISDYATRCQYPSKIKQFMIEHGVNATGENKPLNPYYLSLDKMGVDFPADHFENGNIEAVVVPAVAGQIFDYKDTTLNFSPLKHYWGYKICEYPMYSSWRDFVNWNYASSYSKKLSSSNNIVMEADIGNCSVEKTVTMSGSELQVRLRALATKATNAQLQMSPMFDLNPNAFGDHPSIYVEKTDGTWSKRIMGTETDFWYIAGSIDITNSSGRIVLSSETRSEGVLLTLTPSEISKLSFEYDSHDWPSDQGHKLHLTPISVEKALKLNETIEMGISLKILADANTFVDGIVVNTYDSNSSQLSWWSVYGNGAPAVQHFVVPAGQICTKVEVLVEKGSTTNSSYDAQLQVYDSSNNYLGGGSLSADQFASSSDWVAVDGLSLEAGSYYVQVFTNDIGFQGFMHTQFDASNAYDEGYGAIGWNGGTEVTPVGDFAGRLTLIYGL